MCELDDRQDKRSHHAVLIISTTEGDYVLDNRFDHIMSMEEASSHYIWTSVPKHLTGVN
jgi:predicted transglutaminase-like cysteine proteinase